MTNITKILRRSTISKLKDNKEKYKVISVIFNDGGKGMEDTIIGINRKRDLDLIKIRREKELSDDLLKTFLKNYEEPEKEELVIVELSILAMLFLMLPLKLSIILSF